MRRFQFADVRLAAAFVVLLLAADGANARAGEVRPYEARIVTPGAAVLSGPGENYYPTDTLAQGDVVEVYREHAGGWLGIRPPQDSFSWVFARHVKRLDNGLGEIEKDDVPSRIGSRMSDQRNAVQIRLKKGEVVEIIGEQTIDGQTWYRISPPSGEFRWIQARNIARSDQPPVTASPTDEVAPGEPAPPGQRGSEVADLPPIVTVAATTRNEASAITPVTQATGTQLAAQQEWRAAPVDTMPTDATTSPPAAGNANNDSPPAATDDAIAAAPSAGSSAPSPQPAGPIADNLARRLTSVELQLSRIVAEPPATWQIKPLARDVEQLLAEAQTADERKAVQSTLAKIDRFAAIGWRYRETSGRGGEGERGKNESEFISPSPHLPVSPSGFDAVGTLRPVVSKRAGAPQFALVNEQGQVVSFVTPSPDVNLQPYVGRRIGVTGSRGYIPEFQRAHVTAGRVAPLTERMLR